MGPICGVGRLTYHVPVNPLLGTFHAFLFPPWRCNYTAVWSWAWPMWRLWRTCNHSKSSNLAFAKRCDWKCVVEFGLFCPSWPLDVAIQGYRLIMYTYPTSTWINTNGLIDAYLMGCDNARGFASKDGLLRHNPNVHKLYVGPANMLFCNGPDCPPRTRWWFGWLEPQR